MYDLKRLYRDRYPETLSVRIDPEIRRELARVCGVRPRRRGRPSPSQLVRRFLEDRGFLDFLRAVRD